MSVLNHFTPSAIGMILVVVLLLFESLPAGSAATTNEFQVQTVIVVDRKGFQKWTTASGKSTFGELKKEIESNMVDVTDIYKSLQRFNPPLTIGFEIVDILLQPNWFGYQTVDIINALDTLQSWSLKQKMKYDLALLYTGFDLVYAGNSEHGVAWIEGMCTNKSVAILEIQGTPKDPLTIAHEIGHSLGSRHDGPRGPNDCNHNDGFNMASSIAIDKSNHFKFSNCSYNSIYKHLVTNGYGNCLLDGNPKDLVKGPKGGVMLSPDEQCKRRFGKASLVDREHYHYDTTSSPDRICAQLRCVTSSLYEKYVASGDGISCGKNKQCMQGSCIKTSTGNPDILDSCPLGQQTTVLDRKNLTCDTLPEGACFKWKPECCEKCANYELSEADAACKRLQGPKSLLLRSRYENNWGDALCEKLHCEGDYFYDTVVHDTPEGMKCGKNKVCKNKKCVEGPGGDPNMPDHCPYGDRPWIKNYKTDCEGFKAVYGCSWRAKAMCCVTCPRDVQYLSTSADEVCQSAKGEGWAFARGVYTEYGDTFCSQPLNCVKLVHDDDGVSRFIRELTPVPKGLICGSNKVCSDGKCRRTGLGYPHASDDCPWGDQPLKTIGYNENSCAAYPDRNKFCKENKHWCCETCR